MFELLALLTNRWYWKLHSVFIKWILRCYKIKIGKNFYIEGVPYVKIRGRGEDIIIGDNVSVFGPIDLRNRERGKIIIGDNVSFDGYCRLVAANDAVLSIGNRANIGARTIMNCGTSVTIKEDFLTASDILIQSSQHSYARGIPVFKQKHEYGEIKIGSDVWLGSRVVILKDVELGEGCIVGAHAVVTAGQYESNSVLAGIPAKKIKERL